MATKKTPMARRIRRPNFGLDHAESGSATSAPATQ